MANREHNPVFYGKAAEAATHQFHMDPELAKQPLYQLLQSENIKEFNARRAQGENVNLNGALLRGLDLRKMNAVGLDMRNSYLRGADLRGVDFRTTQLEGASLAETKISGCFFPNEISAEELRLSVEKGTRLRIR
jgi:uncharacterized protein YjbI with pentapeptide repeats